MSKKLKKQKRQRFTQLVIEDYSREHTQILDRIEKESSLNNEEAFVNIGLKLTTISKPIQTPIVFSYMEPDPDICKQVVDDPFLSFSQTPLLHQLYLLLLNQHQFQHVHLLLLFLNFQNHLRFLFLLRQLLLLYLSHPDKAEIQGVTLQRVS